MVNGNGGLTNINSTLKNVVTNVSQINSAFASFATALASTLLRLSNAVSTAGSVTSVGLAMDTSVFTVTGSPITSAGTFTATFTTQTGNEFFVSPNGGGVPAFRTFTTNDFNAGTGASTSTFWRGDLTWATPPAQKDFIYLGSISVANGTMGDTTILASNAGTYRSFMMVLENIVPTTQAQTMLLQVYNNGVFQTTNYSSCAQANSGGGIANNTSATAVTLTSANAIGSADPGLSGTMFVSSIATTTTHKVWNFSGGGRTSSANPILCQASGHWNGSTGSINGFQLLPASGTLTAGSIDIYGIT